MATKNTHAKLSRIQSEITGLKSRAEVAAVAKYALFVLGFDATSSSKGYIMIAELDAITDTDPTI